VRTVVAVVSGRADETPLSPVLRELENVSVVNLEGKRLRNCIIQEWPWGDCLLLVLGDRYEALAAALSATYAQIPIAHIHGGEASFGSFDNQIRDAITKLAHIHFVAAEPMKDRLLDLGEQPSRIYVTGAPGLDNLTDLPPRTKEKRFVCTYHPATLSDTSGIYAILRALEEFPDYEVIWTGVNNDPGSEEIRRALKRSDVRSRLGFRNYVNLARSSAALVGNSSSGIIEAPTLEVPTVNVGPRQDGRLKGSSIFDCTEDQSDIVKALRQALEYTGPFDNPYGEPGASQMIAKILRTKRINMRKEW